MIILYIHVFGLNECSKEPLPHVECFSLFDLIYMNYSFKFMCVFFLIFLFDDGNIKFAISHSI